MSRIRKKHINRRALTVASTRTPLDIATLSRLVRRLKTAEVARVNVKYQSENGRIEWAFEPYSGDRKIIHASSVAEAHAIEAECLALFAALQEHRYPRWWKRAGGFGVFEWDIKLNTLCHFHHARKIEVVTTRREGF